MRTTLNIDDDLLKELKREAQKSRVPLRQLVNALLRRGMAGDAGRVSPKKFRCPVFSMGQPRINLDKAISLAADLEDAEVLRELELRK